MQSDARKNVPYDGVKCREGRGSRVADGKADGNLGCSPMTPQLTAYGGPAPSYPPRLWGLLRQSATTSPDARILADDHGRTLTTPELLAAAEFNKVIEDASPLGKPYGEKHE